MKGIVAQMQEDKDQNRLLHWRAPWMDFCLRYRMITTMTVMLSHKRTIMTIFQLFLKIEDEEGDNGSQEQEDKISYILAFLRDGDGFAEVQDKDDGGDATSQRWFGTIHRIKNQVL